ncbi:4-alpha-glucanotransferase [Falsiroseomonas bella]|uniref:4-alpha-glucanotransferase n=1 Tax=Falsiroseomonas bella TaxID=2184016 RepID=A0A317F6Q3_9PROT|nr:glycogen debranching protein GlgX [Falsiroseomonas bella]PWS34704.1 4-alpha-glucanotransferase [Falsiroseomonas bella]
MQAEAAAGSPEPLGATVTAHGANFAFPAPDATAIFICVFDTQDREVGRIRLPGRTGDVHHGEIAGIEEGARYGLRVEGRWDLSRGHRFNPQKLLVDPWARALDRPFALHAALFDTGVAPDAADSAPFLPKAILTAPTPPAPPRVRPRGPQVIYELHAKGFTALHPEVPGAIRGTFAGLAHPAAISHLRRLGVTAVEIMPGAAWVDERHLPPLGLSNYWGYNPVAFLCPDPRLAPGGMAEVHAAVRALQEADIAVILDVVLNHSGEGDALGPTLSLKGLGNAAFYRLQDGRYVDDAGCGNALALDRPWPLRLAMDALRHWAAAGFDGIRLDLATTLARREAGFDADAPLIQAMRQDPLLRERLIIAEPWDIGPEGYRLGAFPAGWGEWNDRFRDDVRRFWRGDAGMVGALATRLAGSADAFRSRPLSDSVNFVAAHDGFTLADLVSFTAKRNHPNGEANRDGTDANHAWNNGVEGPSDDPAVRARRHADIRALLATLLVARGKPMLAMGDEAGRSQGGNNNAYAQDNPTSWLDWAAMDHELVEFTARMIAARRAHPALHGDAPLSGNGDATWLRPDGAPMTEAEWHDAERRALVLLLEAGGDRCVLALNAGEAALPLALPSPRARRRWRLIADSSAPGRRETPDYLPGRAVLLLAEERITPPAGDEALLARLADAAGIATSWHEISGRAHAVPQETLRALLGAMDLPAGNAATIRDSLARLSAPRALPRAHTAPVAAPCLPLALSDRPVRLRLELEDGEVRHLPVPPDAGRTERLVRADGSAGARRLLDLPGLPPGRHVVRDDAAPEEPCHLAVVPRGAFLPSWLREGGRRFGLAAQIYALRRAQDQGIGDFRAVAEMAELAGREGAALLGLSPPHALFPTDRARASPYHPADRRFLDPILIDVGTLPLLHDLPAVRAVLAQHASVFAALREGDAVRHAEVWQAKRAVLEAAYRAMPDGVRDALGSFRAEGGAALAHFCAFTAIAEQQGHTDARRWPAGLRHGHDAGVAAFVARHEEAVAFAAFQQMLADMQLAEAGRAGAGLYRDLAVGAAPDGAEPWSGDQRVLPNFSIGAPPDPFSAAGQVWGLPPPDPRASAAQGHAAFAALLRANMRHAAALRIDHVLGLQRLFVVPDGAAATEGAYLRFPLAELLGQVALESQRAHCLVVGEDLGTVPEGLGAQLREADILSYRVLWFERRGDGFAPVQDWPARATACVSTHDLPTLAGFWTGEDLRERAALGHLADLDAALAERARDRAALCALLAAEGLLPEGDGPDTPLHDGLAAAIHALVARAPSALMLTQLEDLAGEAVAVNLPGTDRERPNWRRRLPATPEGLVLLPRARAILERLRESRPG